VWQSLKGHASRADSLINITANGVAATYRSGRGGWIKVKTTTWREQNQYRHELFKRKN
jgi:hypothetical protein